MRRPSSALRSKGASEEEDKVQRGGAGRDGWLTVYALNQIQASPLLFLIPPAEIKVVC